MADDSLCLPKATGTESRSDGVEARGFKPTPGANRLNENSGTLTHDDRLST